MEQNETGPPIKEKIFPAWIKVLTIAFASTFVIGYAVGVQQLKKDSGKEGVPHWYENYAECVQYSVFDGLAVAVPSSVIALAGFGCFQVIRKLFGKDS